MGTTVYLTTTAQFHLESSYPFQVDSITVQRVSDVQGPRRVWAPIHGGGGIPRKAPWSSPRRCRPRRRSCGPIILTSVDGSFCNWHQSRTAHPAKCVVSERPRPPPTESKIDLYHPQPRFLSATRMAVAPVHVLQPRGPRVRLHVSHPSALYSTRGQLAPRNLATLILRKRPGQSASGMGRPMVKSSVPTPRSGASWAGDLDGTRNRHDNHPPQQ